MTREVSTADPFALNLMRITVDGKPLDDPGKCSSDVQRCTDVALNKAHIQFKYDSLKLEPRLNVTAWPHYFRYRDLPERRFPKNVHFRLYTNYRSFIERAEVRIFEEGSPSAIPPCRRRAWMATVRRNGRPSSTPSPLRCTNCNTWCGCTIERAF